jgi:hypothetical protein
MHFKFNSEQISEQRIILGLPILLNGRHPFMTVIQLKSEYQVWSDYNFYTFWQNGPWCIDPWPVEF